MGVGHQAAGLLDWLVRADVSGDSGLTILFDDAPDPHDVEPDDPRITLVHLSCLIDDHPELGRGLDIAREYGVADRGDDGEWVVGDLSRLDPN